MKLEDHVEKRGSLFSFLGWINLLFLRREND